METGDAPDAPDAAPANAEEEGLEAEAGTFREKCGMSSEFKQHTISAQQHTSAYNMEKWRLNGLH
jgi:hypothetical protein